MPNSHSSPNYHFLSIHALSLVCTFLCYLFEDRTRTDSTQVIDRDENLFQMLEGQQSVDFAGQLVNFVVKMMDHTGNQYYLDIAKQRFPGYRFFVGMCASLGLLSFKLFMMMIIIITMDDGDCW